jgi:RNA polymerase sigma factor (sigma-70 family)
MDVGMPPFQRLLDDMADDVHRFLVSVAGPNDADDCFQETFLAALRAYPRLRPDSNLRGWVLTIAYRKGLDAHRARGRRAVPVAEPPERALAPPSLDGEPALWARVDDLPAKQRAAVRHRFVDDLAYADIGRLLTCSEEAARRSVHEGLKKLRGTLT